MTRDPIDWLKICTKLQKHFLLTQLQVLSAAVFLSYRFIVHGEQGGSTAGSTERALEEKVANSPMLERRVVQCVLLNTQLTRSSNGFNAI